MLFISPHPQYQLLGIRHELIRYHPTNGREIGTTPGINAEFFHGGAPRWAIEQALSNPKFQGAWAGLPDGVDYGAYIATYDTDFQAEENQWDEETKEEVEQFLLNHRDYGERYTLASPPVRDGGEPWPGYDDLHHTRIINAARAIDANMQEVLAYEKANKNRPVVVKWLEREIDRNPQPAEELVSA